MKSPVVVMYIVKAFILHQELEPLLLFSLYPYYLWKSLSWYFWFCSSINGLPDVGIKRCLPRKDRDDQHGSDMGINIGSLGAILST